MIIIVVLIGAFVMNAVLVKIYGHLWEKHLDARVEFQKEPSLEGRDAILTETIYNRKWLFFLCCRWDFRCTGIFGLPTEKIQVSRINVIKEISFR